MPLRSQSHIVLWCLSFPSRPTSSAFVSLLSSLSSSLSSCDEPTSRPDISRDEMSNTGYNRVYQQCNHFLKKNRINKCLIIRRRFRFRGFMVKGGSRARSGGSWSRATGFPLQCLTSTPGLEYRTSNKYQHWNTLV